MLYLITIISSILLSKSVASSLTPEQLIDCMELVAIEYLNEDDFNQSTPLMNVTMAAKLIEDHPYEMDQLCESAERLSSTSGSSTNKPVITEDKSCIDDITVLCNPSQIGQTPGEYYLDLRDDLDGDNIADLTFLANADEYQYTDGNVYSQLLSKLEVADNVGNGFSVAAAAVSEIPILGSIFGAIDAGSNTAREAFRKLLDKADLHDGVLISQQLSAIYNDRERIISNQKYLDNKITQLFNAQNKWLENRFNEIEARMIELFNKQNEWNEIKYNDLFDQLNTMDKLIRTPNGQRPGWNGQELNDLFIEPTVVDIPTADINVDNAF
mmetsp:Transcript_3471/g.2967  ORF Transcript_3471/g.2967 Transcript_3471/m.2967 type:complete len:326 (+) Transcript_3471:94-1071(+)